MIIAALKGLIMADEAPTPEEMVPSFLHAFMWASAFGVVEEARSKHLWFAGGLLIAAVTFHFVGIRWPQIKPKVGPRVASTVELIASNRLYLRAIYSGIAIALLVSIPLTVYRHYHRAADKSAAPSANSSNAVQTTTPPKGQFQLNHPQLRILRRRLLQSQSIIPVPRQCNRRLPDKLHRPRVCLLLLNLNPHHRCHRNALLVRNVQCLMAKPGDLQVNKLF